MIIKLEGVCKSNALRVGKERGIESAQAPQNSGGRGGQKRQRTAEGQGVGLGGLHMHTQRHAHAHAHTQKRTHTCTHTFTYAHGCASLRDCACIHTYGGVREGTHERGVEGRKEYRRSTQESGDWK